MEEERTGRGPRGEQSTEREAWATRRAGCRSARKRSPSLRESGLQGGHGAQGGDLRDTDRGVADARPHRGREPVRVPAQLGRSGAASRERRAQRAFPDTPPGSLKGPGSPGLSPFPRPPRARTIASRSAPARLHPCRWSCPLLGSPGGQGRVRRCWSLSHFLEELCHSPRHPRRLFSWPL